MLTHSAKVVLILELCVIYAKVDLVVPENHFLNTSLSENIQEIS